MSGHEQEDFSSQVKLRLIENDYAVLRRFEGRSSLSTYLVVVIQRLFLDERVRQWGKWRPSAVALRLGPRAVMLDRLINREGMSVSESVERMAGAETERRELAAIADQIPRRVSRRFVGDEHLAGLSTDASQVEEGVERREAEPVVRRAVALLRALLEGLPPQDRLVLRMKFEDGSTLAEIAAALRLEAKALYRRLDRLLKQFREAFEAQGLEGAMISQALSAGTDVGGPFFYGSSEGRIGARPSPSDEGGGDERFVVRSSE